MITGQSKEIGSRAHGRAAQQKQISRLKLYNIKVAISFLCCHCSEKAVGESSSSWPTHQKQKECEESVSQIKQEGELREATHRSTEANRQRQRVERQANDLNDAKKANAGIDSRWQAASKLTDAYKLNEALTGRQKECDAVMKDKLTLRRVFVDEQKTKDEEFVKELRKQADDIGSLQFFFLLLRV